MYIQTFITAAYHSLFRRLATHRASRKLDNNCYFFTNHKHASLYADQTKPNTSGNQTVCLATQNNVTIPAGNNAIRQLNAEAIELANYNTLR